MKRLRSLAARSLVAALLLLALTANVASADPGTDPGPTTTQPVDPGSAYELQPVDPGSGS